jgi:hypothetical protein
MLDRLKSAGLVEVFAMDLKPAYQIILPPKI